MLTLPWLPGLLLTACLAYAPQHSKVAAKTGNITYQWQIMQSMGIPDDEIAMFADPMHWLQYFPPAAMDDLKTFGLKADWYEEPMRLLRSCFPAFSFPCMLVFHHIDRLDTGRDQVV